MTNPTLSNIAREACPQCSDPSRPKWVAVIGVMPPEWALEPPCACVAFESALRQVVEACAGTVEAQIPKCLGDPRGILALGMAAAKIREEILR